MELYSFDDDYVRRLRDGDRWTEEHFHRYFNELLLIKLRRRLPSMQAIEDVRQEVFVRVFRTLRSPEGVREGRKLGSFVNSVCNNVLLESFRSNRDAEPVDDLREQLADDAVSVEQALVTGETTARVRRVLDQLEPKDAQLLRDTFLEERDRNELCREYGVDRDYLRVLLHRAKEKFRAAYSSRRGIAHIKSHDTETANPSLFR